MPATVPNQRVVNIHREHAASDFLGIKNENWMAAARDLGPHATMLYLYLAANRDGYTLALSPAAINNAIGMARSTYHDQFRKLVNKGYLVQASGNTYDFYEVPRPRPATKVEMTEERTSHGLADENGMFAVQPPPQTGFSVLPENIEINNKNRLDRTINNDFSPWNEYNSQEDEQEEKSPSTVLHPKPGEYIF